MPLAPRKMDHRPTKRRRHRSSAGDWRLSDVSPIRHAAAPRYSPATVLPPLGGTRPRPLSRSRKPHPIPFCRHCRTQLMFMNRLAAAGFWPGARQLLRLLLLWDEGERSRKALLVTSGPDRGLTMKFAGTAAFVMLLALGGSARAAPLRRRRTCHSQREVWNARNIGSRSTIMV